MRRWHCLMALLFPHFSRHLRHKAGAVLVGVLVAASVTQLTLKEAYAAILVKAFVDSTGAVITHFIAVKSLLSLVDKGNLNRQIECLKAAKLGLEIPLRSDPNPDNPTVTVSPGDANVANANNCVREGLRIIQPYLNSMNSSDAAALTQAGQALTDLTTCTVTVTQPAGAVNVATNETKQVNVAATIPLTEDNVQTTVLLDGAPVGSLARKGTFWGGAISLDGTNKTADTSSQIKVTATAVVENPPQAPTTVTCTSANAAQVNWVRPPSPQITGPAATPDSIVPTEKSKISFLLSNAKSGTVTPLGVPIANPTSVPKRVNITVSPSKTTDYVITATNPGAQPDTATATVKVTVKEPAVGVTITAPAANALVTDTNVTVTGVVNPPPPQGEFFTARISVNGAAQGSLPIDASGQFSTSVSLTKTTPKNKVIASGLTSVGLSCDADVHQAVTVANTATADEVKNVIEVAVDLGGSPPTSASASVTVSHAVRVTRFHLVWAAATSGCAAPDTNTPLNLVLAAGGSQPVGDVVCGHVTQSCSVTPTVNINTSLDALPTLTAEWQFTCDGGGGDGGGEE